MDNKDSLQVGNYQVSFISLYTPSVKKKISKLIASAETAENRDTKIDAQYDAIEPLIKEIVDISNEHKPKVTFQILQDNVAISDFNKVIETALEKVKHDPQIYETLALAWDLIDLEDAEYLQKKMREQEGMRAKSM